jgi:hypothetical protein
VHGSLFYLLKRLTFWVPHGGNPDIEFENMDFLELTSSEEHLLFEAVCNVSSDVPIAQSEPTRTVDAHFCTFKVLG